MNEEQKPDDIPENWQYGFSLTSKSLCDTHSLVTGVGLNEQIFSLDVSMGLLCAFLRLHLLAAS